MEFWRSAGWELTETAEGARICVTDDWFRAYLLRPELALVDDSCRHERALHEKLLADPKTTIDDNELDKLALRFGDQKLEPRQVLESLGGQRALTAFALEGAV